MTELIELTQQTESAYSNTRGISMADVEFVEQEEKKQENHVTEQKKTEQTSKAAQEAVGKIVNWQQRLETAVPELARAQGVQAIRDVISQMAPSKVHDYIKDFEKIARELENKKDLTTFEREVLDKVRSIRRVVESEKAGAGIRQMQAEGDVVNASSPLAVEVLQKFSEFTSKTIAISPEGQVTIDGNPEMQLSPNVSAADFAKLGQKLIEKGYLPKDAFSKLQQFATDLKDAALFMDTEVFSSAAIAFTYNAGNRLEAMLKDPDAYMQQPLAEMSFDDIQTKTHVNPLSPQRREEVFLRIIMGKDSASLAHAAQVMQGRVEHAKAFSEAEDKKTVLPAERFSNLYEAWFKRWYDNTIVRPNKDTPEKIVDVSSPANLPTLEKQYQEWLSQEENRQKILRVISRSIEKGMAPDEEGKEGRLVAHMHRQVEQVPFFAELDHWKNVVQETSYGQELSHKVKEIAEGEGDIQKKLEAINQLFQPQEQVAALQYLPAEVVKLFEQNNPEGERNLAACVIADAYVRNMLEQQGMQVSTELEGNHTRLVVVDPVSKRVFRMDPNIAKVRGNGLEEITGTETADKVLNGVPIIKTKRDGNAVVIARGKEIELSTFMSNMTAMAQNGELSNWPAELQLAAAQYATQAFPDNAMAWLLMSKLARDGNSEKYLQHALRLDPEIQRLGEKNEYKIGIAPAEVQRLWRDAEANMGSGGDRGTLTNIIKKLDPNFTGSIDRTTGEEIPGYGEFISRLVNLSMQGNKEGSGPILTDSRDGLARYLMEFGIENILMQLGRNPQEQFRQPDLYVQSNINTILTRARNFDSEFHVPTRIAAGSREEQKFRDDNSMELYLHNLQDYRRATHELFRLMLNKEQFKRGVAELLRTRGMQFIENLPGVSKTQRIYEKKWAWKLARQGRLPSQQDFREADEQVADLMMSLKIANDRSLMDRWGDGQIEDTHAVPQQFQNWQVERASREGMRLSALSQRRLVYAVLGDIPTNFVDYLATVEGEFIARSLAGLKLIPYRFFQPKDQWGAQRYFMDQIIEDLHGLQDREYGLLTENGRLGLYGQSEASTAILDTGVSDPKTNGWRIQEMFLRRDDYKVTYTPRGGSSVTMDLGRFVDKYGKDKVALRSVIEKQRLFLGILIRHGGLDNVDKAIIWKNIVNLQPSRIAAFLPNETFTYDYGGTQTMTVKALTDVFMDKLHRAEEQRVFIDSVVFNTELGDADKARILDLANLGTILGRGLTLNNLKDLTLSDYLRDGMTPGITFTDQEKAQIAGLQKLGLRWIATDEKGNRLTNDSGDLTVTDTNAIKGGFARMYSPFTAFLDDVPSTNWTGMSEGDLERIILNDQEAFEKGAGQLTGIIVAPVKKPDDAVKVFHEVFGSISSPMGVPDAQKKIAVYMSAYAKLTRENMPGKLFGAIMKVLRMPRSELEKHNRSANIAHNELVLADFFKAAAQEEMISDEPDHHHPGRTMYQRLRKSFEADPLGIVLAWLRMISLILGPIAAINLLKAILPGDLQKALG